MALPTNKIKKVKLPDDSEYEIIPERLGKDGYSANLPTLTADSTIALTSDIPSVTGFVPYTGATNNVNLGNYNLTANQLNIKNASEGYIGSYGSSICIYTYDSGFGFTDGSYYNLKIDDVRNGYTYELPTKSGTVALTNDLTNFVTTNTAQTITGTKTFDVDTYFKGFIYGGTRTGGLELYSDVDYEDSYISLHQNFARFKSKGDLTLSSEEGNIRLFDSTDTGTGKAYYRGSEIGTVIEIVDLTTL